MARLTQEQIVAEVWRALVPVINDGEVMAHFGPCNMPIEGGRFYRWTGHPPLEFQIVQLAEHEYRVYVTKIGDLPILDGLPRGHVEGVYALPHDIFAPDDPFLDDYRNDPEAARHYSCYTEICQWLQPNSILEIGVRAGYSAYAMLRGAPQARYIGIDKNDGSFGGRVGYLDYARTMLNNRFPQAPILIERGDSQLMTSLPHRFDLAHIDGAHGHDHILHDLMLCAPQARRVLVDDVNNISTVSSGLEEFLYGNKFGAVYYPTWRGGGLVLIETEAAL